MSRTSFLPRRNWQFTSLLVLIFPILITACGDKNETNKAFISLSPTSCSEPLVVPYHSNGNHAELLWFEKHDLVMSATGFIPSGENGQKCREDTSVALFRLSPPGETSTTLQHIKFEKQQGDAPKKTLEQSGLAQKTISLIRDGECEQAWDYLTPFIVEGSTEAAGVLWAASTNVFSTGKVGKSNGINATGMDEFGITGKGLELSLANASLPNGKNDIHTGSEEIRARIGSFLNIQLEDVMAGTGCDFRTPSFECRNLAMKSGKVKPIETYLKFLTEKDDEKYITCNRRK